MIQYSTTEVGHTVKDGFSQVMTEAADHFANEGLSILGEGFKNILTDTNLFAEYKGKLTEGTDANGAEALDQLMENSKLSMLQEASLSAVDAVSSLTMPVIRKVWPRVSLKNVIPTTTVKVPNFTIGFFKPYVITADGVKKYLPEEIMTDADTSFMDARTKTTVADIAIPADGYDLFTGVAADVTAGDKVDTKFFLTSVSIKVLDADGVNPETVIVEISSELDIKDNIVESVTAAHSDGTVTTDKVFLNVDTGSAIIDGSSVKGSVTAVTVDGYVDTEQHSRAEEVSFEIVNRDIKIGTDPHITTPLPAEFLQDTLALYKVDGTLKAVEIMTSYMAQKIEREIKAVLDKSIAANPKYAATFDCFPSAAYSGSPKEWIENIKTVIDYQATRMINDSAFKNGHFVILGNALDVNLIPNVNWVVSQANETSEVDGVTVNYTLGAFSGTNRYTIVSTPTFQAGKLMMFFVSSNPDEMTYHYYPYSFMVTKDNSYRNPNNPSVPSIAMFKRDTKEVFTELICEITVKNNNGLLQS